MSETPTRPTQEQLGLREFASLAHLPPELIITLLLHALNDHVTTHGNLAIPFHIVTGCNRCPFAKLHPNVTTGPW